MTYPDILTGKKLMYVHGFASSAQSNSVRLLSQLLPETTVVADDIPLDPFGGLDMLREMALREQPDLIVGTSMGGMYAEMLRGFDRILVNPAFEMGDTMSEHGLTGKQTFMNPRKDGVQDFIVTKATVKEYKRLTEQCFLDITPEEQQRVFGLFGDNDPLVHTFPLFSAHYPNAIQFHGGHHMTESMIHHYLLPLIRRIDDRQAKRQRPVVYIHSDAMRDSHGRALPSLHKAYEQLLATYDVHLTAPYADYQPQAMADMQQWMDDIFSAPSWHRRHFTNHPELLVGDYLISRQPAPAFIGTHIPFATDNFKTWDDILTFFARLGGQ